MVDLCQPVDSNAKTRLFKRSNEPGSLPTHGTLLILDGTPEIVAHVRNNLLLYLFSF